MYRSDRTQDTRVKYTDAKRNAPSVLDFSGDARDGRSWTYWMALWLGEALRVTRLGGVLLMFCDWRQLPSATDALQAGGWLWRGIVPWIKPDARPQLGRFTQAAEFVVWATAGPRPLQGEVLPGYYLARAPRATDRGGRHHITQKPLDVMRSLVRICPPGGLILDPFAGSGQTGVAAVLEGRAFLGVEITEHYHQVAIRRIGAAQQGYHPPTEQLTIT